jgi:hypothetical protein
MEDLKAVSELLDVFSTIYSYISLFVLPRDPGVEKMRLSLVTAAQTALSTFKPERQHL